MFLLMTPFSFFFPRIALRVTRMLMVIIRHCVSFIGRTMRLNRALNDTLRAASVNAIPVVMGTMCIGASEIDCDVTSSRYEEGKSRKV